MSKSHSEPFGYAHGWLCKPVQQLNRVRSPSVLATRRFQLFQHGKPQHFTLFARQFSSVAGKFFRFVPSCNLHIAQERSILAVV